MNLESQSESVSAATQPPFVLENRLEEPQTNNNFRPAAVLWLSSRLRVSGLLNELPSEELKTLLLVFTYITSNGEFVATPELLASALDVSVGKALSRLERLASLRWQDQPILAERKTESGLRFFSPSPSLFEKQTHLILPAPPSGGVGEAVLQVFGRSQPRIGGYRSEIIARSRQNYARPRAQVEAEINRFLGHDAFDEPENATPEVRQQIELLRRLAAHGIAIEHAETLVQNYLPERIKQQLDWISHRPARNPAALLKAAIENNYEMPPALRFASPPIADPAPQVSDEMPQTQPNLPPLQFLDSEPATPDATEGSDE